MIILYRHIIRNYLYSRMTSVRIPRRTIIIRGRVDCSNIYNLMTRTLVKIHIPIYNIIIIMTYTPG